MISTPTRHLSCPRHGKAPFQNGILSVSQSVSHTANIDRKCLRPGSRAQAFQGTHKRNPSHKPQRTYLRLETDLPLGFSRFTTLLADATADACNAASQRYSRQQKLKEAVINRNPFPRHKVRCLPTEPVCA